MRGREIFSYILCQRVRLAHIIAVSRFGICIIIAVIQHLPRLRIDRYSHHYSGSEHSFGREVNGIAVSGNSINLSFDPNMKLTDYSISYSDVKFTNPKNMLTAEQAFEKFKADNELTLCYKARLGEKTTATVLVYSAESSVYCDAFTGKPVYDWWYGSNNAENDLSGIKDKKLLKMAEALDDNGIIVGIITNIFIAVLDVGKGRTIDTLKLSRLISAHSGGVQHHRWLKQCGKRFKRHKG